MAFYKTNESLDLSKQLQLSLLNISQTSLNIDSPTSKEQKHYDTKENLRQFSPKRSLSSLQDLKDFENLYGLRFNPYHQATVIAKPSKRKEVYLSMIEVARTCSISDMSFMSMMYAIDKIVEQAKYSHDRASFEPVYKCVNRFAVICLYIFAKFEDQKFPIFEQYNQIVVLKSGSIDKNSLKNIQPEEVVEIELFILSKLELSLIQPLAIRFYERYARIAFCVDAKGKSINDSDCPEYCLGIYLLFIACYYPDIQFDFPQSLIAASCIHCVLRIRNYPQYWSSYLQEITGYKDTELFKCSEVIIKYYMNVFKFDNEFYNGLRVVYQKFKSPDYHMASMIKPTTSSAPETNLRLK